MAIDDAEAEAVVARPNGGAIAPETAYAEEGVAAEVAAAGGGATEATPEAALDELLAAGEGGLGVAAAPMPGSEAQYGAAIGAAIAARLDVLAHVATAEAERASAEKPSAEEETARGPEGHGQEYEEPEEPPRPRAERTFGFEEEEEEDGSVAGDEPAVVIDGMADRIKIALLAAEVKGSSGTLVAERTESLLFVSYKNIHVRVKEE
jgi:hypothetical protein